MATLPVRNLGQIGVVTDVNPYDLPNNALSDCRNVVFYNNRISRAPVFKKIFPAPVSSKKFSDYTSETFATATNTFENASGGTVSDSRFVASYSDPSNGEVVMIADKTGEVRTYPNGNLQFATPTSGVLVSNEEPWTHAQVAGISVLARKGMVPYGRKILSDTEYAYFSGEWSSSDTCAVIRPYLDYMVALNIVKGSTEYPTMVKWSSTIQYGTAVADVLWDPTDPTNSAGENVLAELKNPILDGLVLGSQFIIYSSDQVYIMEYTGSELVFNFRRLFPTGGIINTNCVVEVEGKHYVFGSDDIYVHDGVSRKSIADGRIRRRVFDTLLRTDRSKSFVIHDPINNFIYFCYRATESGLAFQNTAFCNKAAVYNYRNDTWSFMDLPNVAGGADVTVDLTARDYSGVSKDYSSYNTQYTSFNADTVRVPAMVGVTDVTNGLTESRTYGIDLPLASKISIAAELETVKESFVERQGLDLDETGLPLRSYKTVTAFIPQAEFASSDGFLTLRIGSADLAGEAVSWRTTYEFTPRTMYRVDTKASGRYLGYKLSMNYIEDFKFSGFDAEVISTSRR